MDDEQPERVLTRVSWDQRPLLVSTVNSVVFNGNDSDSELSEMEMPDDIESEDESDTTLILTGDVEPGTEKLTFRKYTPTIPDEVLSYRTRCKEASSVPIGFFEQNMEAPRFEMNNHGIGPGGAQALGEELASNHAIKEVILRGNCIGSHGAKAMAKLVAFNHEIEELDLFDNNLLSDGIQAFAKLYSKENPYLKSLNLGKNGFLDMDSRKISKALSENMRLEKLNLSWNRFGDIAAVEFGEMLKRNSSLSVIDLTGNCIRTRGALALAEGLSQNSTLKEIYLGSNYVGNAGAIALADVLSANTNIEKLVFDRCRITSDQAFLMFSELIGKSTSLNHLDLSYNQLSQTSIQAILDAWSTNSTLTYLGLKGVELNSENQMRLKNILEGSDRKCDAALGFDLSTTAQAKSLAIDLQRKLNEARRKRGQYGAWSEQEEGDLHSSHSSSNGKSKFKGSGEGKMRNGQFSSKNHTSEDEVSEDSSDPDSDDEQAVMQSRWRRDRRRRRRWAQRFPDIPDPMEVLEDYVFEMNLRLVDLFFAIDKDRSGGVTEDELLHACSALGLDLSEEQQIELMARMDTDNDGVIDYKELCEGRRRFQQKQHEQDPRWGQQQESDSSDED
eukprot:m.42802 g.42802  ORF g.42802 m.42802 type:complete len:616 (+) comp9912_c0_seq3:85-1932(+)